MYVPAVFAEKNLETLHALIEDYGFASLVSNTPEGPVATHLPIMLDRARGSQGTLVAHLARANPHARVLDGADVLAIFLGPHGYISPSWYGQHPAVPTWNYAAVHVYGRARLVNDPAELDVIVRALVHQYESGRAKPWTADDLPADYMKGMLRGIVGVEIEITRLEGKLKLSQNRNAADRKAVIAALQDAPGAEDRALGAYMARHAAPPDSQS
jgi:transcriptional regulator